MEFSLFILGLIIGSFLNMLIYRLPLGISLIKPLRSHCPSCKYILKWYENIPLVSYIFLKAKCSNCNHKISLSYFIVEISTAIITLILYNKIGFNYLFFIYSLLFYTLILLSFIDIKYKAVPDYLLILLLIISFFIPNIDIKNLLIFAGGAKLLELFVTFYIQNIKAKLSKDDSLKEQISMGEGDIPIIAIIGGILGLHFGFIAIFLSAVFAIIPSILNNIIKKDIETAFIPFLSLGLFVVFILDNYIINILEGIK